MSPDAKPQDAVSQNTKSPRIVWRVSLNPLLLVSALLAIAYGAASPQLYAEAVQPYLMAAFKASSIVLLAAIAAVARSRLLSTALVFGAAGDIALALGRESFVAGAIAFLLGHLCYIALFWRAGGGIGALKQPLRLGAMAALIVAAIAATRLIVPRDTPLFVPLAIYSTVLTAMAASTFTLPAPRWLAMAGAVLFFVSDGFVAANMFHPIANPNAAYWTSFAGWMLYWAGQAGLCIGALGLHKPAREPLLQLEPRA